MSSWLSKFSVTRMLPSGPVISERTRAATYAPNLPSGGSYVGDLRAPGYVVPLLVFGVTYDLDLVVVTEHPRWDMHEYARVDSVEGPIWLAKDALAETGNQLLVADVDDLFDWLPEIPLARKQSPVRVEDNSTDKLLDVRIAYENHFGEDVDVHYVGKPPLSKQRQRNGSTMGHSRQQVMAVLDVSHRDFAKKAAVSIGGVEQKIHRVAGLVPMQLALQQTQGGVAKAEYWCRGDQSALVTRHRMTDDYHSEKVWSVDDAGDRVTLVEASRLRSLRYEFRRDGAALELERASVTTGDGTTNFAMSFTPAIPDVRYALAADWQGRWVMDVGDQRSHAVGTARVRTGEGTAELRIDADKPWWAADRSIQSSLSFEGGQVGVETTVLPASP